MQNEMETKTRATPYLCEYEWKPDRRQLDGLMLDLGRDPEDNAYLDDMNKALGALRGIRVEYQLIVGFRWPAATLASLGDEKTGAADETMALGVLKAVNSKLKSTLVLRAIEGQISPRQPGVDFGELAVVLDMPAGTLSTTA